MIPCVPAVPLKIPHAPTLTLEDFLNLFGISQEDMATHHRMIALDVTHWTYFCPNLPLNVKAQTQRLVIQFLKRLQLLHHSEVMERLGCAISDKRNKQIIGHAWDSPADQLNCHSCADLDLEAFIGASQSTSAPNASPHSGSGPARVHGVATVRILSSPLRSERALPCSNTNKIKSQTRLVCVPFLISSGTIKFQPACQLGQELSNIFVVDLEVTSCQKSEPW
ncbi:hypothetical protein PCANC_02461 [Puccinia coronata f. sp. avenae]|uniref:Uncharacterized protein n=1 Tax=Puccinia coronata f. sp. avenae TaxID=200324 RepID=A0A2N5W4X4_9BASI|nr:hypothetical protein PCANC_02461 [Puccinia coronata f. sp. avenae]